MLRTLVPILITLVVALGGGAASAWYLLRAEKGVGAVTIGSWTAYPLLGSPQADPYSKARAARAGLLALGRAEGIVFTATSDAEGRVLSRRCSYRVEGLTPPARFFTLYAADGALAPLPGLALRAPAVQSLDLLRRPDSSFLITVGPGAAPGNWLPVSGDGPMTLVLTLYDTQAAASGSVEDISLPSLTRMGCDG